MSSKTSKSDMDKRKELFLEFLYYVFDSILIPLIRSNFHVTESNAHGNRIFYFRHDLWRALTEPSLATIKLSMFEEMSTTQARKVLDARTIGFSQIRLLPKARGVRPIMNLRRRVTKLQSGKAVLGRSINAVMAPVFNMLSYERLQQPDRLGSALFSVGDIYPRLKAFRSRLDIRDGTSRTLYFAKVDVQSCFDTIPQCRAVKLIEELCSEEEYRITRHAEIRSSESHGYQSTRAIRQCKPTRKFIATARASEDFAAFEEVLDQTLAVGKKGTVFVDSVVQTCLKREQLLNLLREHVQRNIVKIGKKFFRQKQGIPQGSVLSSILCNFFYAEFERECLEFIDEGDNVLLRLIDDFLFISTNKRHATKFLDIMHAGNESYGIQVKPEKTLTNFDYTFRGLRIPRLSGDKAFPYCGTMIDTATLDLTKDRDRRIDTGMSGTRRRNRLS